MTVDADPDSTVDRAPDQPGRTRRNRLLVVLGAAVVNLVISSRVMLWLTDQLLQRHRPGVMGVDMGQGPNDGGGLGTGRQNAETAITTWQDWAELPGNGDANSWEVIAQIWLAVDVIVFAIGGYGLFAAVTILLARGTPGERGARLAPSTWRAAWVVWGGLLLVVLGVDIIETIAAVIVVRTEADAFAGVLAFATDVKWIGAALALVALVVAVLLSIRHLARTVRRQVTSG